jgi:uncharacterized glyoxalase superfamily metalloenzyme YdcJ
VPILLRQTSFKALSETITFTDAAAGKHTARFGEIEQRGLALTPAGRALYDRLLQDDADFSAFPDDIAAIRQQQLGYFRYTLQPGATVPAGATIAQLESLIDTDVVRVTPIIYEDFLPVSAAGIFQSNLGSERGKVSKGNPNKQAFEQALGCAVLDEFTLYQQIEDRSLAALFAAR